MSVSHRHIIIAFRPGLDGGFSQTITCQYRTGSGSFVEAVSERYGLGFLNFAEILVSEDLEPATTYSIRLVSDNEYPEGQAVVSGVITATTRSEYYGFI